MSPIKLNMSKSLPRPQLGINMWSQQAKAKRIHQEVDENGNVQNIVSFFNFDGVIQPLKPEEIKVKEEAQWSWDWYWFHTKQDVNLQTNDRVVYKEIEYKIMAVKDYSDYGHIEYHCIKDWQNAN
jgi:hypothetical protein|nr:MAG TPA: head closure knob [Caudoviricetes sp.]